MIQNPKSVIRLEFILGTTIEAALHEMKEKTEQFNVAFIYARINDIDVYVHRNSVTSVDEAVKMVEDTIKDKREFVVIN